MTLANNNKTHMRKMALNGNAAMIGDCSEFRRSRSVSTIRYIYIKFAVNKLKQRKTQDFSQSIIIQESLNVVKEMLQRSSKF